MNSQFERVCPICEEAFVSTAMVQRIYCDSICAQIAASRRQARLQREKPRHRKICELCKKRFLTRTVKGRFCSSDCRRVRASQIAKEKEIKIDENTDISQISGAFLKLRFEVLKRDEFRCQYCGRCPKTHKDCILHVDHIHPKSKGGLDTLENLTTACFECNEGKTDILLDVRMLKKSQQTVGK